DPNVAPSGETVHLLLSVTQGNSYEASLGYTYNIGWSDGSTQAVTATAGNGSVYALSHQFTHQGTNIDSWGMQVSATGAGGSMSNQADARMVFSYLTFASIRVANTVPGWSVVLGINSSIFQFQTSLLYLSDLGGGDPFGVGTDFTVNFDS